MSKSTLKLGDWNAICDRCGRKFKASELKKTWDNLYVCKDDWEPRHPMDFFRGKADDPSVPWTRQDSDGAAGTAIDSSSTGYLAHSTYVGDEDKTLTVGTDPIVEEWNVELTANRTVTLSTVSARSGSMFHIYRTGGGSFILDVGGVKTIPANIDALVIVRYNGNAWILESYTPLGL